MSRLYFEGGVLQAKEGEATSHDAGVKFINDAGRGGAIESPQRSLHEGLVSGRLRAIQDFLRYRRAKADTGDGAEDFAILFRRFVSVESTARRCVRLGFDDERGPALGANWLPLSLDHVEQRAREGQTVSLDVEGGYCDAVFCSGLERISQPASLIAEVRRMLRRGGQVWVQAPLCGPYLPPADSPRKEYWRFTPEGLQLLLKDFDEILCSVLLPRGSPLRSWSYFYGIKSGDEAGEE